MICTSMKLGSLEVLAFTHTPDQRLQQSDVRITRKSVSGHTPMTHSILESVASLQCFCI